MGKKTEKTEKKIELTRINPDMIQIKDNVLTYKRVKSTFVQFSETFKKQVEFVISKAWEQAKATDQPVRLNKVQIGDKVYNPLEDIKELVGNNDNLVAGATLFANIPRLKSYVGLFWHDLYAGMPHHFKTSKKESKNSITTIDVTNFDGLPDV